MDEFQLTTPVVLILFNRPDKTREVFREIARARPKQLLVIGDGPRPDRTGEADRVANTRAILNEIDWPCTLLTEFSDVNLGCKKRLSSGLDWVFRQVEDAIILEDDCLPHPSFFRYCQELLDHYRYDSRIGMISGDNFQNGFRLNEDSYYFSNNANIWGWATWRDRWQSAYDVTMAKWPNFREQFSLSEFWDEPGQHNSLAAAFDAVYAGKIDTWDYQWLFAHRINGWLSIIPNVNLISNIGFDQDATHTIGASPYARLPISAMEFPLRHPDGIFAHRFLDRRAYNNFESGHLMRGILYQIMSASRRIASRVSGPFRRAGA